MKKKLEKKIRKKKKIYPVENLERKAFNKFCMKVRVDQRRE